jgi:metal-sulfur cluster biosynthetic enzyme
MKPLPVVPTPPDPAENAAAAPNRPTAALTRDADAAAVLEPRIVETLATVFDPEIPVNIIVDARHAVGIRMTLTAPSCPSAQALPAEVKHKVAQIPGVTDVTVDVVWDPPWDRDRMSETAKLQLGMF